MIILGCDPGTSGALAVLRSEGDRIDLVSVHPIPRLKRKVAASTKDEIDIPALCTTLRVIYELGAVAYVERVGARPGQGVSSMFAFGRATGQLEAALVANGWPVMYATPQAWKRRFGLSSEKEESLRAAKMSWPAQSYMLDLGSKAASIAAAEAALIGKFGAEREMALRSASTSP